MFPSTLLLLAFLFLSADGRSTSPWNRRLPSLASRTPSASNNLMLPLVRGGESSASSSSNTALPTPASLRIGDSSGEEDDTTNASESETSGYTLNPNIIGGHILRAGKVDPLPDRTGAKATNATDPDVVVESFVTKQDKATKKILKRHKQIAKKLRVRIVSYRNLSHRIESNRIVSHSQHGRNRLFPFRPSRNDSKTLLVSSEFFLWKTNRIMFTANTERFYVIFSHRFSFFLSSLLLRLSLSIINHTMTSKTNKNNTHSSDSKSSNRVT
jgi:hypothetical protein